MYLSSSLRPPLFLETLAYPSENKYRALQTTPSRCAEEDYKMAVETHTRQLMGFQGNMLEACQKFEGIEEEHLAQMITFVMKMSEVHAYM